jgi:hypothetical protein
MILETRNGITPPRKYLQKAFFPLKGAVTNGVSPCRGDSRISLLSMEIAI